MLLLLQVKILPQVKVKRLQWGPSHHGRVCHLLKTGLPGLLMTFLAEGTQLSYILCGAMSASLQMCWPQQFRLLCQSFSDSFQDSNPALLLLFPVCCAPHSLPSHVVDFCQIGTLWRTCDKWASEWIYEQARAIIHVTSQLEIIFQGERKNGMFPQGKMNMQCSQLHLIPTVASWVPC